MIKILSLDGGPGPLLNLRIIRELELRDDRRSFLEQVDLFAGTSDGGLMSLYLADQLSRAQEARESGATPLTPLAIIEGCIAFAKDYAQALLPATQALGRVALSLGAIVELSMTGLKPPGARREYVHARLLTIAHALLDAPASVGELWGLRKTIAGLAPVSSLQPMKELLEKVFGRRTLGDLRKNVVVMSFDTKTWSPRAFRNFGPRDYESAQGGTLDRGLPLVEVALSTLALPLFLPVYSGEHDDGYFDGVFSANNPCTTALSIAVRDLKANGSADPLDEVIALSMGVRQTVEEANIQRVGGTVALIALLLVEDRDVRMMFSVDGPRGLLAYLRSPAERRKVQASTERAGLGGRAWGWLGFVRRPILVANMLVNGNVEESARQSHSLLGDRFFRHAPRINMARALFRTTVLHQSPDQDDLSWNCERCFGADFHELPPSGDEIYNREHTGDLLRWLPKMWFYPDVPTALP